MSEAPVLSNATLMETSQGLEVVVPAPRNWAGLLFLPIWLCGWGVGEFFAVSSFFRGGGEPGPGLFLMIWVIGWTLGGVFALYTWLWLLGGRERLLLTSSTLALRREMFGIGLGRWRELSVGQVRDVRVMPAVFSRRGQRDRSPGNGLIAFDHGEKTFRFGGALEPAEALLIVERLLSRASFGGAWRPD